MFLVFYFSEISSDFRRDEAETYKLSLSSWLTFFYSLIFWLMQEEEKRMWESQ